MQPQLLLYGGVAVLLLLAILILPSIHVIGPTEVGLVMKRFSLLRLSDDNPVAFNGEAGYQAALLGRASLLSRLPRPFSTGLPGHLGSAGLMLYEATHRDLKAMLRCINIRSFELTETELSFDQAAAS